MDIYIFTQYIYIHKAREREIPIGVYVEAKAEFFLGVPDQQPFGFTGKCVCLKYICMYLYTHI